MAIEKVLSADSHVVEPPDLWEKRIDPKFRDRAPRLVWTGETDCWFVDKDIPVGPGGEVLSEAGKKFDDREAMSINSTFEKVRPGAYDSHARLKDLETDGVVGEVIIPTIVDRMYGVPVDSDLLSACFRAYNDWIADFCKPYPDIFKGMAMLNLDDIQDGLEEFDRCLKMGLSGAIIPVGPGEDKLYYLPEYEKLWATAAESNTPLLFHAGTQRGKEHVFADRAFAQQGRASKGAVNDYWPRRSIADMIFSEVFERYPALKILVVEFEMGWVPHWLQRMDSSYSDTEYTQEVKFPDNKVPSDYWHSNMLINFMEDKVGMALKDMIGVDNIVFGSDFPHRESTWPHSRRILDELLGGMSEEDQNKIAYSTTAKLMNFPV